MKCSKNQVCERWYLLSIEGIRKGVFSVISGLKEKGVGIRNRASPSKPVQKLIAKYVFDCYEKRRSLVV